MHRVHLFILVTLSAISSCGQTGPLYLPDTKNLEKENLVEREIVSQTMRD